MGSFVGGAGVCLPESQVRNEAASCVWPLSATKQDLEETAGRRAAGDCECGPAAQSRGPGGRDWQRQDNSGKQRSSFMSPESESPRLPDVPISLWPLSSPRPKTF